MQDTSMTHSGMSSSHLCVRVFLCICLHDTKTTFHSRTRHSGVSSFQKLCSLEKVARAYLIWCENHASENTLQAKPFDFIMWMQYKLHSGMKLMNKLWNESHSSIISMAFKCHFVKYQFFLFVLFKCVPICQESWAFYKGSNWSFQSPVQ